jgi:hypothetical protein
MRHPQFSTVGLVAYYKLWAGLTSTANVFDYSLNGFTGVPAGTDIAPAYPGFTFNNTDDEIVIGTGPTSVLSIIVWIKLDDISGLENIISLNNLDSMRASGDTLVAVTFTGGTTILYVDAVESAVTLDTGWRMATITTTIGKDADILVIGRKSTTWYGGKMGEIMLYDRVLSPAEIKSIYELTRWRYRV